MHRQCAARQAQQQHIAARMTEGCCDSPRPMRSSNESSYSSSYSNCSSSARAWVTERSSSLTAPSTRAVRRSACMAGRRGPVAIPRWGGANAFFACPSTLLTAPRSRSPHTQAATKPAHPPGVSQAQASAWAPRGALPPPPPPQRRPRQPGPSRSCRWHRARARRGRGMALRGACSARVRRRRQQRQRQRPREGGPSGAAACPDFQHLQKATSWWWVPVDASPRGWV